MGKGKKPTSTLNKGSKGRKNHGPKRHLHNDYFPTALRMQIQQSGAVSKYDDFDSFCVSLQARGVRADYKLMWSEFKDIKMIKNKEGDWVNNRAAQKAFFADAKNIAAQLMKKHKGARA